MKIRKFLNSLSCVSMLAGCGFFALRASADELLSLLGTHGAGIARINSRGRPITEEVLHGHVTTVSFVSQECSILCVMRVMDLDKLAQDLPERLRGRVVYLVVDTNPAINEGPRFRAFEYDLLGIGSRLRFLPLDADAVKAVAEALCYPLASLPKPLPTVLIFDRRGQAAMNYGGGSLNIPHIARDIAVLDTSTQGVGHPPASTEPTR